MLRAIRDYSLEYKPNDEYTKSPGWLLGAHKAAYPHIHEWDHTQIIGRPLQQPKMPSTYFVKQEAYGPKVYAPRATSLADAWNTSTPKANAFMSPFMNDRPVPVKFKAKY
jgi:hypothetical protein